LPSAAAAEADAGFGLVACIQKNLNVKQK